MSDTLIPLISKLPAEINYHSFCPAETVVQLPYEENGYAKKNLFLRKQVNPLAFQRVKTLCGTRGIPDTIRANKRRKNRHACRELNNNINSESFEGLGSRECALTIKAEHKTFAQMKSICKSLRIKERQLRNKRRKPKRFRRWAKPIWYKVDINDPHQLILRNGTRIRQFLDGVDLYLSEGGAVYSLTRFGLRRRRVDVNKKSRYGLKSCNGVNNGQTYPYVTFRGHTYRVHIYMALLWIGPCPKGHEIDHLNGNIDDWRRCNLDYVTVEENRRRAAIIRRLRKAAQDLHDPSLDPRNMSPKQLDEIFNGGV